MPIMRLTVGPLPSAVYWRRRAVVLGVGLLFLIVLLYSCGGPGGSGDKPRADTSPAAGATSPPTEPSPTGATPTPGNSAATPDVTASSGSSEGGQQQGGSGRPADVPVAPPAAPGSCADSEMSVTPVASPTTVRHGNQVSLKLKIKNISARTCSRDVGPDLQELFIKVGAQKLWSSDTCGTARGSDVRTFPPNQENEYGLVWNGRDSSKCDGTSPAGQRAGPGEYQVFARLGTKLSEPIKLTIVN